MAQSSSAAPQNNTVERLFQQTPTAGNHNADINASRRVPSPSQQPRRETENEPVYILTLLTDQAHHDRMTALRKIYFPRKLNKLDAHLTLFHVLPESKLESSIIPVIEQVASQTMPFSITARTPGQLGKHGMGVFIPRNAGGDQIRELHSALQEPWKRAGWLSVQDAGGMKAHYTIMNKIDDETEVQKAFDEVRMTFRADEGRGEGFGLWRYDRGWWRWVRGFRFAEAKPE
ncbi:hypothetical protein LTR09_004973 [Extremus antarcticus]|uniref:2'-5' RNA ligase family protein n=1 Tax=Extremus antarcticus TaxID=702011 RepID=A0AAJ0DPM4_9PEZI|nr:hypothetical protein LTR09_004973 [Extremus antarcticus]